MPLLCDLGWHRPDPIARWNDGYYFSKCSRCGRDLVRTAFGQWQVPKGYRVVWQQKPPETREEIALVPETAGEAANGAEQSPPAASAPVAEAEQPVAAEPVAVVEAPMPSFAAATPEPEVLAAQAEVAAAQRSAEVTETAEPEPATAAFEPPADEPLLPLNGPAPAAQSEAVITIEPPQAERPLPDHFPIEDLLHQSNGTGGHEVHEAGTAIPEHSAPAPSGGRQELPIEEVLRHLHSTPLPPTPSEDEASESLVAADELDGAYQAETSLEPAADQPAVEEVEPPVEAALEEVAAEPEGQEDVSDKAPGPEGNAALPEVAEDGIAAPAPADIHKEEAPKVLQRDLPEPHFEPRGQPAEPSAEISQPPPPPERQLRPIKRYSSDWDFMKEDEEDPITTFWEQTEPAASAEEPSVAAPSEPEERVAEEARQPDEPLSQSLAPAAMAEEVPPAAEDPKPRPMAVAIGHSDPFAAPPEPQLDAAAPVKDTVPVFRPIESSEPIEDSVDVVETPPWVDRMAEGDGEEEAPRSRTSRFVITATVSMAVLAVVALLASQPQNSPAPTASQQPAAASPDAAPIPPKQENRSSSKAAPAAAKKAALERSKIAASAAPPVSAPLPALPGRAQAFVSASVLQCRSAPVDRAAPVRKLVRGAQVQILAREGEWMSIAHKGRQCWAAARFLSAAEPW